MTDGTFLYLNFHHHNGMNQVEAGIFSPVKIFGSIFCGDNTQLLKSMTQHFWEMSPCEIRIPRNCLRHNTQLIVIQAPSDPPHGTADVRLEHAHQTPVSFIGR